MLSFNLWVESLESDVVQTVEQNPGLNYRKITRLIWDKGHNVSSSTISRIMKQMPKSTRPVASEPAPMPAPIQAPEPIQTPKPMPARQPSWKDNWLTTIEYVANLLKKEPFLSMAELNSKLTYSLPFSFDREDLPEIYRKARALNKHDKESNYRPGMGYQPSSFGHDVGGGRRIMRSSRTMS